MRQSSILIDKKAQAQQEAGFLGHAAIRPHPSHAVAAGMDSDLRTLTHDHEYNFANIPARAPAPTAPTNYATPVCPVFPRQCPFGGACHTCPVTVQAKLAINQPGDSYEQEADQIADQVIAMPAHSAISGIPPLIQRFPGKQIGQTKVAPASVEQTLAGSGRPLEPALRRDMEQRFGYDFSQVRMHTGADAVQSARDVNASAFTLGTHIVFGEDRFSPDTQEGRHLIAHELTHVLQQQGGPKSQDKSPKLWNSDEYNSVRALTVTAAPKIVQRDVLGRVRYREGDLEIRTRNIPDWRTFLSHVTEENALELNIFLAKAVGYDHYKLFQGPGDYPSEQQAVLRSINTPHDYQCQGLMVALLTTPNLGIIDSWHPEFGTVLGVLLRSFIIRYYNLAIDYLADLRRQPGRSLEALIQPNSISRFLEQAESAFGHIGGPSPTAYLLAQAEASLITSVVGALGAAATRPNQQGIISMYYNPRIQQDASVLLGFVERQADIERRIAEFNQVARTAIDITLLAAFAAATPLVTGHLAALTRFLAPVPLQLSGHTLLVPVTEHVFSQLMASVTAQASTVVAREVARSAMRAMVNGLTSPSQSGNLRTMFRVQFRNATQEVVTQIQTRARSDIGDINERLNTVIAVQTSIENTFNLYFPD